MRALHERKIVVAELHGGNGDRLVPDTSGACPGTHFLVRLSPVDCSTPRAGAHHVCSHALGTVTHSKEGLRLESWLTNLLAQPFQLDLELANLPAHSCLQPFGRPTDALL